MPKEKIRLYTTSEEHHVEWLIEELKNIKRVEYHALQRANLRNFQFSDTGRVSDYDVVLHHDSRSSRTVLYSGEDAEYKTFLDHASHIGMY